MFSDSIGEHLIINRKLHCNATLSKRERYTSTLVEESWLLIVDTQFAVDGSQDSLYLTQRKHTAE